MVLADPKIDYFSISEISVSFVCFALSGLLRRFSFRDELLEWHPIPAAL